MKELTDLVEVLSTSADPLNTAIALLVYFGGRAAIRQAERQIEHLRERQTTRAFTSLSVKRRRDMIRLQSSKTQD
ncbi:hypothetical protein ACRTEC_16680 [Janibacter indicus]